ncbi:YdcF family protein [Candidatus Saccharibacteria bacterium]|nr:YdcF family protein [Candidatus Saccharibacteria bacterium]
MSILNIIGSIVYRLPNFIKDKLEKIVFLNPQIKLPDRHTGGAHVAIIPGGATGRIEKALELYRCGVIDYFLVSGGIGRYSVNKDYSEAEEYAQTLADSGVPDNHIWIENSSTNTIENMAFSTKILVKRSQQSVNGFVHPIVITSGFHLKRTVSLLEKDITKIRRKTPMGLSITQPYWAPAPFASCELSTWRDTPLGCGRVTKEAICLFLYRLRGKI